MAPLGGARSKRDHALGTTAALELEVDEQPTSLLARAFDFDGLPAADVSNHLGGRRLLVDCCPTLVLTLFITEEYQDALKA